MKNTRFFTLIEVLVVIVIIVILGLIGYGSYTYAKNAAKTARSEALFKNLQAGLESFYNKTSYYPSSTGGDFNAIVITLGADKTVGKISFGVTEIEDNTSDPVKQALFDSFAKAVDLEQLRQCTSASGELTDAWGAPVYYRAPGVFNQTGYDLVAAGPDGKFSSGNADTPVGITDLGKFRNAAGEHLCDDLFNF